MPQKTKHTPMMEQYLNIKKQYPDVYLFYRLGDFYELFFDDAVEVAQMLELTLTSRNKNAEDKIPMCGVPHHSAQRYIDALIERGHKVAICEQVEDAKLAKGMVKREVVQVITPGTVMNAASVDAKENNYIAAVLKMEQFHTLAYADLTTGELKVTKLGSPEEVKTELQSLKIKEVLFEKEEEPSLIERLESDLEIVVSKISKEIQVAGALTDLKSQCEDTDVHQVLDLLLTYLAQTQMRSLDHLQPAQQYETSHYMIYGQEARRNLELSTSLRDGTKKGTLLWLLDETKTAMGGRLLRNWLEKPLITKSAIENRLNIVQVLMDHFFERTDLTDTLTNVYDLERLAGRVAFGTVNARDLVQLKNSLIQIPKLVQIIQTMNAGNEWTQLLDQLDPVEEIANLIETAIEDEPPLSITDGEIIKLGYQAQLDEYKDAMINGKKWIANMEAEERAHTGIKNLKIGFNKVFGYYIEVTRSNVDKIDEQRYQRKQTLTNAERYSTPELKEKEALILEAEEKSKALEYELFSDIREQVKAEIKRLQKLAKIVAQIDCLQSFAYVSETYGYVRPEFNTDSQDILIKEGRHPVVEKVMKEQVYVPNDISLEGDTDILLITGPNMSGKSTYMRQLALTVIMAQMGCYVPGEYAKLPIFDRIFTRIGAMDDLIGGQSTFMVEMMETNHAMTYATSKSLLLFDEIGRGTATYDGMALAEAIIEHVHDEIGAKTLFSTHYHELTVLEDRLDKLKNIHVGAVEEDGNLVFLHKMLQGPADKSYGVQVAKLAGLPEILIDRASGILSELEQKQEGLFEASDRLTAQRQEKPIAQPSLANTTTASEKVDEQLSLFVSETSEKESNVIGALKETNIMNLTPLQAMTLLNELQEKLK
ncbi:DNA mismatch repair protein MutS [Marinilactibacillus kalidii]|uniref:DNA mismatch repair protein MutS n=1 Tax=Marinilactibacillus kalidii TaxID=2820274 RepID=UPI001ABDA3F9|nr:DNA mismatch repair protein MutS [Marinilactibacillus kalidii]